MCVCKCWRVRGVTHLLGLYAEDSFPLCDELLSNHADRDGLFDDVVKVD